MAGNDANTVLLLHLDGTNGSTTITDASIGNSGAHSLSTSGGGALDTSQLKFGTASWKGPTSSASISTSSSADWQFGSGDFTIDFWIRTSDITKTAEPYNQVSGAQQAVIQCTSGLSFLVVDTGPTTIANYSVANVFSNTTWVHVEIGRQGTTLYMFVGGVLQSPTVSTAISTNTMPAISANLNIAQQISGSASLWIDEFRISKGLCRHTATFTPQTSQYTSDYSLASTAAAFTLTAIAATLTQALSLTAVGASFVLIAFAAVLTHAKTLVAATASFVITGVATLLRKGYTRFRLRTDYILQQLRITAPSLEE